MANLGNEKFGVSELARELRITRSWLNRKVYSAKGKTAHQFIQELRLRKALDILRSEDVTASEVAYRTGFGSPAYFNTCFREFFGYPPGKIRKEALEYREENILIQVTPEPEPKKSGRKAIKFTLPWVILTSTIIILTVSIALFFKSRKESLSTSKGEKSVAVLPLASDGRIPLVVMPFQNLSNDSDLNYFKEWIPESLTSLLSNYSEDLEVRQTESLDRLLKGKGLTNASITPSVATLLSQKLDANVFISGSLIKDGSEILINAKLINSKTVEVLRSFKEEASSEEIIQKIDSLSHKIKDYLMVARLKKELPLEYQSSATTNDPEALRYYILGREANRNLEIRRARREFLKAISADTNFIMPYFSLIHTYMDGGLFDSAKIFCLHLYGRRDQMEVLSRLQTECIYCTLFNNTYPVKYLKQLLEIDDQQPSVYFTLGQSYLLSGDSKKAIPEFEKSLEIYKKWSVKPAYALNYTYLGFAYIDTKEFIKAEKIYKRAEEDFPDDQNISEGEFRLSLALKDTVSANNYLKKFIIIEKKNSLSEYDIAINVAYAYEVSDYHVQAKKYIQKALALPPDYPGMNQTNELAWILIDNDLNIQVGLDLVAQALKLNPDNYAYLDTKGWGLYKVGKYNEALNVLQKADSLKPNSDPTVFIHIQEVEKALASQKKTN